ncbi:MAG: S8 family serine peptidase, partial [Thermoleophilia bacterium]|nr:S8 family serine peptidase [Thermoleophilia bacterium]
TIPSAVAVDVVAALRADPSVLRVEADRTRSAEAAPSDPSYDTQWALPKIGWDQVFGTVSPTGSATVAVLDTGVDASHADLAGQVLAGTSLLDSSDGRNDPNGHGTAMAGIIAANVHDHLGTAGVAQRVRILPVTVLDERGLGTDQDAAQGIAWAVDQGADVINVSLGGEWPSEAMKAAVQYARDKGVVVVAAVGNDGPGVAVRYPAAYPDVIAVGAVDRSGAHLELSNTGPEVDIVAPGASILAPDLPYKGIPALDYRTFAGTSFSTAHVAGVAALLLSFAPGLAPAEVQRLLEKGAVDVGPPGRDDQTGTGRIDAARSLAAARGQTTLPGDVTAPRQAHTVTAEVPPGAGEPVRLVVGFFADDDRARVQVRRTTTRPARTRDEGELVADVPVTASAVLLPIEDSAPPWAGDPAATVAYYTAFVRDVAGNWSNPMWVYARASGAVAPPAPEPEVEFPDVPSDHPYARAIGILLAQGIVSGFPSGTFGPDLPVTRAQFAKMVVLALGIHPLDQGAGLPASFGDVPAADGYPFVYVEAAAGRDIVRGSVAGPDGTVLFGPDRSVTRVQLAQMLARAGGDKLDRPPLGIVEPFYDLPAYAEAEVSSVWEMGIAKGRGATLFDPWKPATRGQVAEMLYRLEGALASRP